MTISGSSERLLERREARDDVRQARHLDETSDRDIVWQVNYEPKAALVETLGCREHGMYNSRIDELRLPEREHEAGITVQQTFELGGRGEVVISDEAYDGHTADAADVER